MITQFNQFTSSSFTLINEQLDITTHNESVNPFPQYIQLAFFIRHNQYQLSSYFIERNHFRNDYTINVPMRVPLLHIPNTLIASTLGFSHEYKQKYTRIYYQLTLIVYKRFQYYDFF